MRPDQRLALAAFCTDLALYLLMLSLPYRVLDLGASSLVLGLVPLLCSGPYSVTALLAGRVSDRWPRRGPIRAGLALTILAAVVLAHVQSIGAVLAAVVFVGIGLGFFWPSLQAGFSEVLAGRDLDRLTRRFNIAWSAGKGLGLLAGGLLLGAIGPHGIAWLAAGAWLAAALALPAMPRPGDHSVVIHADPDRPGVERQRAFLRAAWLANGIAFGVTATLNHHLPKVLLAAGIEARGFGLFLGLVFLAQLLLFVLLGAHRSWRYRSVPLLAMQALLAVAVFMVPYSSSLPMLLLFAPVFGAGLGFAYQSSLYYSLHAPLGRGRQAGVHESVLGITGATIPLVGGAVAKASNAQAPFVVAALVTTSVLVLSAYWLVRARALRAGAAR